MALPMRSNDFRSIVEPIMNEAFDGVYDQRKDEYKPVFKVQQGIPRAYHEEPVLYGFGAAPEMPEGKPVMYQSGGVLFNQRYFYKVFGLAFALTKVLVEDGDAISIGTTYSRHLAQSLIETKETRCANLFNRSFNASFPTGDGVSWISNAHPIVSGTASNLLSVAANMSQTSVEQMCIQIRQAIDNNGKRINLTPKALVCSPQNYFQAEVILKSALRTGTANNDINPLKSTGMLEKGQCNMSRLTSNTAWWIYTGVEDGAKLMTRRSLTKSMEGDFETDSMRYKATERYREGVTDWRDEYGTPGV